MTEPKSDCRGKGYTFINCTWDGNSPEWQGEKIAIVMCHKPCKVKEEK